MADDGSAGEEIRMSSRKRNRELVHRSPRVRRAAIPLCVAIGLTTMSSPTFASIVSATVVPGTFSQGTVQGTLGAGTTYANPNNILNDWWPTTSNMTTMTGTKFAISYTNGNFNNAANGNNTIMAFGNGGGLTLQFSEPVRPVDGQKEFGLFTAQFLNASSGGLFSGNMESAVLVSADNVNWFTLDGASVADHTTFTSLGYKLNAPSVGYNFGTTALGWTYGSPGTTWANLNALTVADYTKPMPDDNLFNGTGTNAQRLALRTDTTTATYDAIFGDSGGGNWFDISNSGLSQVSYVRLNGVNVGGGVRLDSVFANAAAVPEPATLGLMVFGAIALFRRRKPIHSTVARRPARLTPILVVAAAMIGGGGAIAQASPWASQLITSHNGNPMTFGPFHASALWNDPAAVLGKVNTIDRDDTNFQNPTWREIHMAWPAWSKGSDDASLIGTPYNAALGTNNGIGLRGGSQVVVGFDQPIMNNPDDGGAYNWGLDFIVHGNAFFVGQGTTFPNTNMETYHITSGAVFAEPVTVSVAQTLDGPWYTFTTPTADNFFPTQPWAWDRAIHDWSTQQLDWEKPVNPALGASNFAGLSVADAIDLYGGSAGGTGFDIGVFGLDWIQYVKITDPNNQQGEITGIVAVAVPEPSSLAFLIGGFACVLRRPRR